MHFRNTRKVKENWADRTRYQDLPTTEKLQKYLKNLKFNTESSGELGFLKKIYKFEEIKIAMRLSLSAKSVLVAAAFFFSSCATTKYPEDVNQKNFSDLRSGRPYSFKLNQSTESKKMIFSNLTKDSIIGYSTKRDSTRIAIAKANVREAKDIKKSTISTAAVAIGAVGAAAIILSSTRATSN